LIEDQPCASGSSNLRERQLEPETAAAPELALGAHTPTHSLDPGLGDRKAKTGTAAGARPRPVCAIEALKDMAEIVRRDALARVGHSNPRDPRPFSELNRDRAAGRGVPQGIANEVAQSLADPIGVTVYGCRARQRDQPDLLRIGGRRELHAEPRTARRPAPQQRRDPALEGGATAVRRRPGPVRAGHPPAG